MTGPDDAVPVVTAGPDDVARLGELIAAAFARLPASRWLVADRDEWDKVAPSYFAMLVGHALAGNGTVSTTTDRTAVAVWFDNTRGEPQPPAGYEVRLEQICGRHAERFRTFDEALDRAHPAQPHQHLAFLAVRPDLQRTGLGTALLDHQHAQLDARGVAGYLEAATPQLRPLYAGHGYEPLGEAIAPSGDPILWPMWREPRPRHA